MKKKYILALIALCMTACAFTATSCDLFNKDSSDSVSQSESSVEEESLPSLRFTDSKIEMLLGEAKQLSLSNLESGETVTYTSNDENVVTVSANGTIEGKGVGSAVVKATSNTGRLGLIQVVVYDPESYPIPYLSLEYSEIKLFAGDTFTMSYTYSYLGQVLDATVQMTSDNSDVAVVEKGAIRAVGVGDANVLVKATSSYGEAARTVKVTVLENQFEFYPSFLGKDVYMGNPIELTMYVNENGTVKTIDGATFTVADPDIATVEDGMLIPQVGGDTTITCAFEYAGKNYEKALPIHIYGLHTCSFTLIDGTVDSSMQALCGDMVSLELVNADNNPEYNKAIKCWYVNGEMVTDSYFIMPDEDVVASVCFVNETVDNFEDSLSAGTLLNNVAANVQYVEGVFTDDKGNTSDADGYVKISTKNFGSTTYNFDEVVTINDFASIRMRLYVTEESPLLYFGIANSTIWPDAPKAVEEGEEGYEAYLAALEEYNALRALKAKDKKYEASSCGHGTGDVSVAVLPNREWTVLEMPLTLFGKVGEKLHAITFAVASISSGGVYQCGGEVLVDFISINYGLEGTDFGRQERIYFDAIFAEETGSAAQADAISKYYQWAVKLSDEDRASVEHQEHVAEIQNLMETSFSHEYTYINDPSIVGAADCGNNIDQQASTMSKPNDYKACAYERFHVVQFNAAPYDGTITLSAFNYNECTEAYFGLYAIVADITESGNVIGPGTGNVIIGDQTFTFSSTSLGHYFKVWIKDGTLYLVDDSKDAKDGGDVIFQTTLSNAVANGLEGLQIKGEFDAWAAIEITEMYAVTKPKIEVMFIERPSDWGGNGTRVGNFNTSYSVTTQKTFDSNDFDGTLTLDAVNYNLYNEVYFGLHAIAGARSWEPYEGDNGIITIGDKTFELDPKGSDYYFKITIKGGVLTMVVEKVNKAGDVSTSLEALSVALSEDVLSGEVGLVIDFNFGAWSQAEVTDMRLAIRSSDIK